jgi:hypothetical protein
MTDPPKLPHRWPRGTLKLRRPSPRDDIEGDNAESAVSVDQVEQRRALEREIAEGLRDLESASRDGAIVSKQEHTENDSGHH